MCVLLYDGTWSGLLTLIFEKFEYKWEVVAVYQKDKIVQGDIFHASIEVITNNAKALRVWNGLKSRVSTTAISDLYKVFLSELPQFEVTLCSVMSFYFSGVDKPYLAYGRSDVLKVKQVAKMVDRERHRMKAFVRFRRLKDDLYFAVVEPDFNVLPLIRKHFSDRYADQRWLIYDLRRSYGIYYDLWEVQEVKLEFSKGFHENKLVLEHTEEDLYNVLWQHYFHHVNIKERRNLGLHIQHVPRRYWKHLVEKQQSSTRY